MSASRPWALLASSGVFALFIAAVHLVTGGFAHWTLESARRAHAERGRLRAPPILLTGTQGTPFVAWGRAPPGGAEQSILVVDFIFTRCPSVCQTLGSAFQRMQQQLADEPSPGITLLSLSIDPQHDGPAELADYAQRHRADPSRWTVAVPSGTAGVAAIRQHWGVIAIPDGAGGLVHNGAIHLVDAGGRVRGIFDLDAWKSALQRARELSTAAR